MCVFFEEANVEGTIISNSILPNGDHLTIYQNIVENLSDGLNVMILPIPSAKRFGQFNVFDTKNCPNILKDMKDALPISKDVSLETTRSIQCFSETIEAFQSGIYSMVSYHSNDSIKNVIEALPEDKRFAPNMSILEQFKILYPNWWFLLCVFDTKDLTEAHPIMYAYTSIFKEVFFYPTLDSHDGSAPNLNANVYLNHTLIAGTENGAEVVYTDKSPDNSDIIDLLPKKVIGHKDMTNWVPNGDYYVSIDQAQNGSFMPVRWQPNRKFTAKLNT